MPSKNPTLDSFATRTVTVPEYPRAYDDAPETFYDTLYTECERLARVLVDTLPVTEAANGYVVNYDTASFTDFENAIAVAPELTLQAFVPACHMTERIVREHLDIDNLYRYADPNATIRGEADIQAFITRGCLEYLTDPTPLETILFMYFRSQEHNRIQHARGAFYEDVHTKLEAEGFYVKRDDSLPGRPNLVITRKHPIELTDNSVVGKALRTKPNDIPKRARHAATCCGELQKENPNATRVAVFNITGDPFPNSRVREKQRQKIQDQHSDALDAVFFADEADEFTEFCDENIHVFGQQKDTPGSREDTHTSLEAWGNTT